MPRFKRTRAASSTGVAQTSLGRLELRLRLTKLRLMMLEGSGAFWCLKQTRPASSIGVAQISLGQLELRLRLLRPRLMMLHHIFSWWQS